MEPYPLLLEPIYQRRIWGGRRLEGALGKCLPAGQVIGESWEAVDLEGCESRVVNGPARGRTLGQLVREWGSALYGRAELAEGRFPLLIKYLDASEMLSLQVHPSRFDASRPAARPKWEAWYVLDAPEGGFIYRGLLPGTDGRRLREAISMGQVDSVVRRIPVRKGWCYFVPAGTVHALGPGLLVAEIQTPSDTTYRLFDWGRVDPATGKPRELHLDEALHAVDFHRTTFPEERREHAGSVWTAVTTLIRCDFFTVERVSIIAGVSQDIPYEELVVWIVLTGNGTIHHAAASSPTTFAAGDTVILPAGLRKPRVETRDRCVWLEVTLPVESSLAGFPRPRRADLAQPGGPTLVPLRVPPRSS